MQPPLEEDRKMPDNYYYLEKNEQDYISKIITDFYNTNNTIKPSKELNEELMDFIRQRAENARDPRSDKGKSKEFLEAYMQRKIELLNRNIPSAIDRTLYKGMGPIFKKLATKVLTNLFITEPSIPITENNIVEVLNYLHQYGIKDKEIKTVQQIMLNK